MSTFAEPKDCIYGCGTKVYFDRNSKTGHPSADKWIPLEIKEGRRTDVAHNCPKKKNGNGHTLEATTEPKLESLKFAQSLFEVLQEYLRLKTKELEAAAK